MMTEGQKEKFRQELEDLGLDGVEERYLQGAYGGGEQRDIARAFIKRKEQEAETDHQESAVQVAKEANRIAEEANTRAGAAHSRAGAANWVAFGSLILAAIALIKAFWPA